MINQLFSFALNSKFSQIKYTLFFFAILTLQQSTLAFAENNKEPAFPKNTQWESSKKEKIKPSSRPSPTTKQAKSTTKQAKPTTKLAKPTTTKRAKKISSKAKIQKAKALLEKAAKKLTVQELIGLFNSRNWVLQRMNSDLLVKQGDKAIPSLRKNLQNKSLRVRLLCALTLARLKDLSALPFLIQQAQRFHDQPTNLLYGAFTAYGRSAIPALLKATPKSTHPQNLIRVLSYLQAQEALPIFSDLLLHPNENWRKITREALSSFSSESALKALIPALQQNPKAAIRSEILRLLVHLKHSKAFEVLIRFQKDKDSSIRFYARLSAEDNAELLYKQSPTSFSPLPHKQKGYAEQSDAKRAVLWQVWWDKNQASVKKKYQQSNSEVLTEMPKQERSRITLLYQTTHPVFGYGKMPLLIHDKHYKNPPSPIPGKTWKLALPSEQFQKLLRQIEKSQFFQWTSKQGTLRSISIYTGKRHRHVSLGLNRHFAFENLEVSFLALTEKAKLRLIFEDFFARKDEQDLSKEGKIGQWAYRKRDKIEPLPWTKPNEWKPVADLESTQSTFYDLIRYVPSRARFYFIDQQKQKVRFGVLLYGSRNLSTLVQTKLKRSRRFIKKTVQNLRAIYLTLDKIEHMQVDLKRRMIPNGINMGEGKQKSFPMQALLAKSLPRSLFKTISLKVTKAPSQGKKPSPYRIILRTKAKDSHAVLLFLSRLALHSQGDKVLALRISQSGEKDRGKFGLILQMQWEMLTPVQGPKKKQYQINFTAPIKHLPFQPVYR